MKKNTILKFFAMLALAALFCLLLIPAVRSEAATVKLNKTKKTLTVGKSVTLKLKNAKEQHDADYYIPEGGANITFQDDRFLYEDEVRVYDPPDDDHDSGGTSVGSDGFSGSSGSF